jgi:hypothetical protein
MIKFSPVNLHFSICNFDGFVKSPCGPIFGHSRESGNPGNSGSSGLLLPAFAGTSFAGVTAFLTFCEIINFHFSIKLSVFSERKTDTINPDQSSHSVGIRAVMLVSSLAALV